MNAVIYSRVSSKEQVEGTSLESQERACRDYAAKNKLDVLQVFTDRGESAKFADRPQLLEMIAYCRKRHPSVQRVLVWKVDRLARNVGDHFNIKASLLKHDVRVVSVTEPIDANPEGRLLETILAGFAQFDNDIRAARTLQGMRHKIQDGLFPWKAPIGYRSVTVGAKKTQPDAPAQPAFGLLQQAWRDLATGSFTKAEIRRLLTIRGMLTKAGKPLSPQSIDNIFNDSFYAGVVRDPWSGEEYLGKHIPMIDRETFGRVQKIFSLRGRKVTHESIRPDFPLRSFVRCVQCQLGLTGAFSRGRSQTYPYYRCFSRTCGNHTSYPQREVHREFIDFIGSRSPNAQSLDRLKRYIEELSDSDKSMAVILDEKRLRETKRIREQEQQLIRMKMDQLINNEEFLAQRSILTERLSDLGPRGGPDAISSEQVAATLDIVTKPVLDLGGLWQAASTQIRRRFKQWAFPGGYVYGRIGTAQKGRLFSLFTTSAGTNTSLVHLAGDSWNQLAKEITEFAAILEESTEIN
jgi:DNA invertase Pin-like site-specific DNA recombinase